MIADEEQVLQFGGVLLHQQIYAQHQDIETQHTDDDADDHHYRYHHAQEVGGFLALQLVVGHLIPFLVQIFGDAFIGRI